MGSTVQESASSGDDDWPVQAADFIVRGVGVVRDKTTGPAITISRAIVYGLVAAILGLAALVLLSVGLVRLVDVYLPGGVWSAHLLVAVIFTGGGAVLWAKRTPKPGQ